MPTGRRISKRSCPEEVSSSEIPSARCPKLLTHLDATEDDDHRYSMFSATFNKECRQLARNYLGSNHIRIRIGRPGSSHLNVEQQVIHNTVLAGDPVN